MSTVNYCQWCFRSGEFGAEDSFLCPECHARTNGLAIAKTDEDGEGEGEGVKTSFGTMRDFARASNYSRAYYRRTPEAKALIALGRTQSRQGSPSLRCTAEFLAAAKRHAAAAVWEKFTVDAQGEIVQKPFTHTPSVTFEIVDYWRFVATGYLIGGYWLLADPTTFYQEGKE